MSKVFEQHRTGAASFLGFFALLLMLLICLGLAL
jgi:hypothetical protein